METMLMWKTKVQLDFWYRGFKIIVPVQFWGTVVDTIHRNCKTERNFLDVLSFSEQLCILCIVQCRSSETAETEWVTSHQLCFVINIGNVETDRPRSSCQWTTSQVLTAVLVCIRIAFWPHDISVVFFKIPTTTEKGQRKVFDKSLWWINDNCLKWITQNAIVDGGLIVWC